MGVYDTVEVPCPNCGKIFYAQSKGSYDCSMGNYNLINCPYDVLSDVNRHAPFECSECKTIFEVKIEFKADVIVTTEPCPNCGKVHSCYDCEKE